MKDKKLYFKEYYQKNKNKLKANIEKWQSKNKDKVRLYKRKHKSQKREILTNYINNFKASSKCTKCNENTVCCLEFHHRDKKQKIQNINKFIASGSSIESLKNEINKCDILCSNCHRKTHFYKKPTDRTLKFKFVYDIKQHSKCQFCDESHYACLDFHHINKQDKINTIGRMIKNKIYTLEDIQSEIKKCVIVCTNCHRKLHKKLILTP